MEVDFQTYNAVTEREKLMAYRAKLKGWRDIWCQRAKRPDRDEKLRLRALVYEFTKWEGIRSTLAYDAPRLRVEKRLAELRGSKSAVEVNEGLIKQTDDRLAEAEPKAKAAYVALVAELGEIEA